MLSVETFVNNKCKTAQFFLRTISKLRQCLTHASAKTLVQSYVLSKIDYCNSVLYGSQNMYLDRLQKVQNYAARVVNMVPKRSHISPELTKLHWLPIKQRVTFKVLLYTYKALHSLAPTYLSDLLVPYIPVRELRSSCLNLLEEPKFRRARYGGRAFAVVAPKLWNGLPLAIKQSNSVDSFKRRLKTLLFREAFY